MWLTMRRTTPKKKGFFITFEGGEGAGKSTQLRRLIAFLEKRGQAVKVTQEPGGTEIGRNIRHMLLDPAHRGLAPLAELLLYEADRAHHVHTVVRPALAAGQIVISDRFADSSTVYQGICRGLGQSKVEALNALATQNLSPDLVLLLDLPETVGLARVKARAKKTTTGQPDRIEQEKQEFHRKVRRGFLKIARENSRRFAVIDATLDEESVAKEIEILVQRRLERRGLWKRN
jgi:dTMP kinase